MKKLLPILLLVLGLGAGVGAGTFLVPPSAPAPAAASGEAGAHGETEGDAAAAAGHAAAPDAPAAADGHGGTGSPGAEFARLNNQFIVPIVKGADVTSMVVLSLSLEVVPGGTETVFQMEPRIRDNFLRVLFDFANIGGFDASFTEVGRLTILRRNLLEAATRILGDKVRDVLITDIVRQQS